MTAVHIFGSFLVIVFVSGCYTQLMTPQEYVKVRKQQSSVSTTIANNAYSINYNQSCTTCHSVAELNERAEELESYGVTIVHNGVFLSSRPWINDTPGEIYYGDPGPVYWPTPLYPTNPWWAPPVTIITTPPTSTTPANGNRPRTDGSTRDGTTSGGRNSPIPPPTTAQPSAPVGGTTVTPVTTSPAPAVTVTPAPSTTPASTNDGERSRDTNSGGTTTTTKTRSDGSSRDSSGGSRPR